MGATERRPKRHPKHRPIDDVEASPGAALPATTSPRFYFALGLLLIIGVLQYRGFTRGLRQEEDVEEDESLGPTFQFQDPPAAQHTGEAVPAENMGLYREIAMLQSPPPPAAAEGGTAATAIIMVEGVEAGVGPHFGGPAPPPAEVTEGNAHEFARMESSDVCPDCPLPMPWMLPLPVLNACKRDANALFPTVPAKILPRWKSLIAAQKCTGDPAFVPRVPFPRSKAEFRKFQRAGKPVIFTGLYPFAGKGAWTLAKLRDRLGNYVFSVRSGNYARVNPNAKTRDEARKAVRKRRKTTKMSLRKYMARRDSPEHFLDWTPCFLRVQLWPGFSFPYCFAVPGYCFDAGRRRRRRRRQGRPAATVPCQQRARRQGDARAGHRPS